MGLFLKLPGPDNLQFIRTFSHLDRKGLEGRGQLYDAHGCIIQNRVAGGFKNTHPFHTAIGQDDHQQTQDTVDLVAPGLFGVVEITYVLDPATPGIQVLSIIVGERGGGG